MFVCGDQTECKTVNLIADLFTCAAKDGTYRSDVQRGLVDLVEEELFLENLR